MPESMIERIAKIEAEYDGRPWNSMGRMDRTRYLGRAALAITAMREPDKDVGTMSEFKITGPGEYIARDGTAMRVLEYHRGGYWLGRYRDIDPIMGFAWRPDGTQCLTGVEDPLDLVSAVKRLTRPTS